jgi:hypothetical protein
MIASTSLSQLDGDELFDLLGAAICVPRVAMTDRIRQRRTRVIAELARRGVGTA